VHPFFSLQVERNRTVPFWSHSLLKPLDSHPDSGNSTPQLNSTLFGAESSASRAHIDSEQELGNNSANESDDDWLFLLTSDSIPGKSNRKLSRCSSELFLFRPAMMFWETGNRLVANTGCLLKRSLPARSQQGRNIPSIGPPSYLPVDELGLFIATCWWHPRFLFWAFGKH
jgi:hypothetical protein